jgi:hypothetical protein
LSLNKGATGSRFRVLRLGSTQHLRALGPCQTIHTHSTIAISAYNPSGPTTVQQLLIHEECNRLSLEHPITHCWCAHPCSSYLGLVLDCLQENGLQRVHCFDHAMGTPHTSTDYPRLRTNQLKYSPMDQGYPRGGTWEVLRSTQGRCTLLSLVMGSLKTSTNLTFFLFLP